MPSPREKHHEGATPNKNSDFSKPGDKSRSPPESHSRDSSGSPISDDTCAICLGNITDKCMANSCHHCFCLVCLKEWSKQKAVCPLCKESFTTIMYDIKSEVEFKKWKVPRLEQRQSIANFQAFFVSDRRFFGYRTTNFPGAATLRRQHPVNSTPIADAIPSGPRERRSASYHLRGSSFFRREIYFNNEWVQPIADITGMYRQSSPELYREQPALTHRLVPWVNRELAALIPSSRIGIVLAEIMDLIERYHINSREFRRAVRPHLGRRTDHFVHEFYHFARSPYDMVGHDNATRYVRRYGFNDEGSSDSTSSEDSDAVVEVDVRGNPVSSTSSRGQQQVSAEPENVEREEILTQEGSVLISSDENSNNEIPQQSNLFLQCPTSQSSISEIHNPEPSVSATFMMTQLLGRARNFLNSINEGASTSVAEETASARSNVKKTMKREVPSDSDDSDACMIIEEVNKKHQTPEIITLDSEEEEEKVGSFMSKDSSYSKKNFGHSSTKNGGGPSNSHNHQERQGKKKPRLNRTNFPVSICQPSGDDSSRKSTRDHSYCNEQETEVLRCSVRERADQPSSSGVHQTAKTLKANKDKLKGFIISSDSEPEVKTEQRKRSNHKERKYKATKMHENLSQDSCGSSFRHDTHSPSRENFSPARRQRKDHKSKVKNSSRSHIRVSSHKKRGYGLHCVSETSSSSWCNSNIAWTSSSSTTDSSSRDGHWQDGSSSEYSSNSKNFNNKGKKSDHTCSKSRYFGMKEKHRKKDKHKKEKSKKVKKSKHKKKYKSRKTICNSSSDSDVESDSSEVRITRCKRKRSRIQEFSSNLALSDSCQKNRERLIRYNVYSSSD